MGGWGPRPATRSATLTEHLDTSYKLQDRGLKKTEDRVRGQDREDIIRMRCMTHEDKTVRSDIGEGIFIASCYTAWTLGD